MSVHLAAIIIAWLFAQGAKVAFVVFSDKRREWRSAWNLSGGMPSAHSAVTIAAVTTIAATEGFDSVAFALAFLICMVVMYDALNVRRAVGEQGLALRNLIGRLKYAEADFVFKHAAGHRLAEVIIGALTGAAAAGITLYFF